MKTHYTYLLFLFGSKYYKYSDGFGSVKKRKKLLLCNGGVFP